MRPISIQTKNPMFGVLQPFSFRSCIIVSFENDAIVKRDFFGNICAPPMTFGIILVRATLKVSSDGFHFEFVSLSLASASPCGTSPVFQRHHVLVLDWNSSQ